MTPDSFTKIGQLKSLAEFRSHVVALGLDLPADDAVLSAAQGSPLAEPLDVGGFVVGNRWTIHPMEGWDANRDGTPSEHTLRRWEHFGASGAKWIWGGEAFAVQNDGRANPHQLGLIDDDEDRAARGLEALLSRLTEAHRRQCGNADGLLVGLQLTHSGRFCRPNEKARPEPKIPSHHPLLDPRVDIAPTDDSAVVSDDYLRRLIDNFIRAARLARKVGFGFVDVKHCHGYLGHELLGARRRPGPFGGPLENRSRFAREVIAGIQAQCPGLRIGVRLSAFDHPPFRPDPARSRPGKPGPGVCEDLAGCLPYEWGFGCDRNDPLKIDLAEPVAFINMLVGLGVRMFNITCGSPYYNPHVQRPAMFPPSDGYQPPEDPLVGVARQIDCVRQLKQACPEAVLVGTAYTYLQEYLPHVAQAAVRKGWVDSIGIGRLVLSYWDLPADTLAGRAMQVKRICRTFSDCTTGPRNGLISGCYPLDGYYKQSPEHVTLKAKKQRV